MKLNKKTIKHFIFLVLKYITPITKNIEKQELQ